MAKELQKGTVICQSGQPVDSIHMIIKGTVRVIYTGGEYFLEKGDVIGLCDLYRQNYIFTYYYRYFSIQKRRAFRPVAQAAGFCPDYGQILLQADQQYFRSI